MDYIQTITAAVRQLNCHIDTASLSRLVLDIVVIPVHNAEASSQKYQLIIGDNSQQMPVRYELFRANSSPCLPDDAQTTPTISLAEIQDKKSIQLPPVWICPDTEQTYRPELSGQTDTLRVHTHAHFLSPDSLHADDVVGVLRVPIASNGVTAVAMPFEPFGDGFPDSFLAGPFIGGDGGCADSLHHLPAGSGDLFSYLFSPEGWTAQDGTNGAAARPGDALLFSSGAGGGLEAFVYGRVPKSPSLASVLPPGENLLSYGFPRMAFPSETLPQGISPPAGWDGEPILDDLIPWWRAFVVTNITDEPVVWTRARPYPRPRSGFPLKVRMT